MKTALIIINPISGKASKNHIPDLLDRHLKPEFFSKEVFFTGYQGHASELTRKGVEEKKDFIIAVGGDGTINEVARAMLHSSSVLGIIPMGSGNGLARDLSIPMDPAKAIDVLHNGKITSIDYCKANDHIFFCTCGVGFDALVSERFAEEKRRGALTYVKNVIVEYLKFKPETYDITLEEEVITKKAFLVVAANTSQYGNNAFIAPRASIRDGMMDIAILSPIKPLDVGPLVVQLFTKQIDKSNKTEYFKSRKITLKRKKSGVMHIDGEPVYMGKTIKIETFYRGLQVAVPDNPMPQVYDVPSFFSYITRWLEEVRLPVKV